MLGGLSDALIPNSENPAPWRLSSPSSPRQSRLISLFVRNVWLCLGIVIAVALQTQVCVRLENRLYYLRVFSAELATCSEAGLALFCSVSKALKEKWNWAAFGGQRFGLRTPLPPPLSNTALSEPGFSTGGFASHMGFVTGEP